VEVGLFPPTRRIHLLAALVFVRICSFGPLGLLRETSVHQLRAFFELDVRELGSARQILLLRRRKPVHWPALFSASEQPPLSYLCFSEWFWGDRFFGPRLGRPGARSRRFYAKDLVLRNTPVRIALMVLSGALHLNLVFLDCPLFRKVKKLSRLLHRSEADSCP